jgi:hypothetical protein
MGRRGWFASQVDHVGLFTHPTRPQDAGASPRRFGFRINGVDLRLIAAETTRDLWLHELCGEDEDETMWQFVLDQHCDLLASELCAPSRLLLGEPDEDHRGTGDLWEGRVPLLACGACGDWGCWPLLAVITIDDRVVTWSGFVQPHRRQWGELPIGPFAFDRTAYEAALAAPEASDADPAWAWLSSDYYPQP